MTDETERLTQPFVDQTQPFVDETQRFEDEQTERLEDVEQTQLLDTANNPDNVETYVRFGPGVPAQAAAAPDRATAIWRGEVRPVGPGQPPAERVKRRWIMPLTVLILVIAVLIYFLWGRSSSPVAVDSVAVKASTPTVTCGQTERLNAVITTNGNAGTLTYQWTRSDGTNSDILTQNVNKGEHQATVALLWNFDGPGALDATATLHIISPGNASGSATFRYSCSKS